MGRIKIKKSNFAKKPDVFEGMEDLVSEISIEVFDKVFGEKVNATEAVFATFKDKHNKYPAFKAEHEAAVLVESVANIARMVKLWVEKLERDSRKVSLTPDKQCIYCLVEETESTKLTKDHFFPKSWYPLNTPQSSEIWWVPSCIPCNRSKSKLDQKYFNVFASCLPQPYHLDPNYADILAKNLRTFDASAGDGPKDADKRRKAADRFLSGVWMGKHDYQEPVIPTIHLHDVAEDGLIPKIEYDHATFSAFATYIVKAVIYKASDGMILDSSFKIEIRMTKMENFVKAMSETLAGIRIPFKRIELGQAFQANIIWVKDEAGNRQSGVVEVIIWGNYYFYGWVSNGPDAFARLNPEAK